MESEPWKSHDVHGFLGLGRYCNVVLQTSFRSALGENLDVHCQSRRLGHLNGCTAERYRSAVEYKVSYTEFYISLAAGMRLVRSSSFMLSLRHAISGERQGSVI